MSQCRGTKKIPHCAIKFEVGKENITVYKSLYYYFDLDEFVELDKNGDFSKIWNTGRARLIRTWLIRSST